MRWIVAVIFLALPNIGAAPIPVQQAQPSTYPGFEGRNVSKVDISAKPTMNVDAFRALIKQKAGEPFSIAAIHDSVNTLQQTKLFSQVQVSITPEEKGLDVLFILQPSYYVGLVSFPGATKAFRYTRLLQAANIPEQSPFTADLLQQGRKGLLEFFKTNGYFVATVQPQSERDDAHRIVNITFQCDLNKLAKAGEINIQGVSTQEAASLRQGLTTWWAKLKRSSLKPGQKYSDHRISNASDLIRARLRKQGRLAPDVRFVSAAYDQATNRAALTFQANPGPKVSIRVTGAHVWGRTLKKLIPIYQENSIDLDLVDEGERNLTNYFQTKGYFDVKVHTQMDQKPDQVAIMYAINKGIRHRVEGVYFEGNHYFDDDELESHAAVKKGRFFVLHIFSYGSFSDQLVQKSVASLTALYKDAGFASVSIKPKVADFEPQVDVTFQISEGLQDKVGSLRIVGNRSEAIPILTGKRTLNLAPGAPYSPQRVELDRNDILAGYLNLGFLNARFQSSASPSPGNPHAINVVYTINEGPQGRISQVVLLGEERTHPDFITDVTSPVVSKGKPLSEGGFLTTESDLYNLGIFDWVSVKPVRPLSDQTQEDVLVEVHESKRNSIEVGGGIEVIPRSGNIPVGSVALPGLPPIGLGRKFTISQKNLFGPRFTFGIDRHNMFGRAETASFATVLSRLNQSGSFTYSNPRLRGSSWSSLFSLSAARTTENPIFTARLGQASFQVEKPLDAKHTKNLIFRYAFQRTDLNNILIPDLVLPMDRSVRTSTVDTEYVRDTRDAPLDAHRGVFQTFDFGVTPKALGSSADFVRFLGQSAFYIPVRPSLTWANNLRLGFAVPFAGSDIPLSERFFSGGADSLRGFPINGAGPQRPVNVCSNPNNPSTCTLISVPVGGSMLFILNSEARFPLPVKRGLGGVLFYDGGNVYANINFSHLVNDYTNTVGVGLRYLTPVGPIRFDVGYRLTRVPGVRATQYFVTLGQAF